MRERAKGERPFVVRGVPHREADRDRDGEGRPALAEAQRRPGQRRKDEVGHGLVAAERDLARRRRPRRPSALPRSLDQAASGAAAAEYQASATGSTTRAPAKSPSHHVRQTSGAAPVAITEPRRSDSVPTVALTAAPAAIAVTMPREAPDAGQRRAARDQPPHQQRRDQHLEEIAERLAHRGAEGQRRVVVDQEVADQHARPQTDPAEVQEGDGDPDRQPDDGGDRTGELEGEADLGGDVVRDRQRQDLSQVATAKAGPAGAPSACARHRGALRVLRASRRPWRGKACALCGLRATRGSDSQGVGEGAR